MTELILQVFRLHGALIAAGERLTHPLGLTAARWQVLSCVARAAHPAPVAHVAREMGLTRQSVQRIADQLVAGGLMTFRENPNHKRASLAVITARGRKAFEGVTRRQVPWVNDLAGCTSVAELTVALRVVQRLEERLDALGSAEPPSRGRQSGRAPRASKRRG